METLNIAEGLEANSVNPPSAEEFFFEFFRENRVCDSYKPLELFVFIRFFILHL